ncbi:exosome complex component MTR3-like [Atheta coriaria]|uniref:exosome complex component MTR3-like n=1 Tax=Dalotia coriaria TaxID=877792 RepID=UPI0031F3EA90
MPIDNRRINGPENTVPYTLFTKLNTKSFKEQVQDAIPVNGKRSDGRKHLEHRKIFLKTGVVSQAKGSAYIEVGKTKVIVSCYDPREIPNKADYCQKGELYCEFKFATFSCVQRRMFQQDAEEKQNSIILKQALEPAVCLHEFPNFQVDIYALVLENDGSALSASITAAGVALAQASIPMYDLVTGLSIGIIENTFIVDPSIKEEQLCDITDTNEGEQTASEHGLIIMSMLNTHEQISQFYQTGNIALENISKSIDILTQVNKEIVPLVQKCLTNYVLKSVQEKEDNQAED